MALDIRYDADGCEGVLVREETLDVPSTPTLLAWGILGGFALVLATLVANAPIVADSVGGLTAWVVGAAAAAAFAGTVVSITGGAEGPLGVEWATRTVRERFRVRQGVLTIRGDEGEQSAPLAGATIRAFEDGVWVNPALARPIRLAWDGASTADVAQLAEVLERAARGSMQARGTRHDVPEDLARLRE